MTIVVLAIIKAFAISLGVGASTLAIINFFAAIADGKIDETERRMMGIVYVVLRVAMMAILVTVTALISLAWLDGVFLFTGANAAELLVILVLFLNAILMTMRIMPSTIGPGLQAGSWYTLGALQALSLQGIAVAGPLFIVFLLGYVAWTTFAIGVVNGVMAILKFLKQKA